MNLLDFKQARKTIKLVAQAGAKLDSRIHLIGCSGIGHYIGDGNGDATILTELVKAMPKSSRGKALQYWITKNCNVRWDNKAYGGAGGYVKVSKSEPATGTLQEAIDNPFWNKPDNEASEFKGYSRESEIISFMKRLEKKEERLKADLSDDQLKKFKTEVSGEALDMLANFCDFDAVVEA